METILSVVALVVAAASWFEARKARGLSQKAHRSSFRGELREIRSRWRDGIKPTLGGSGGVLTNDQFGEFIRLQDDGKVVSQATYDALRRAYELSNDLTAIHEVTKHQLPLSSETVEKQSALWTDLQQAMREIDGVLEREVRAHL